MAGLKETRTTMLRYLYTTLDVKPELFLYNPQIKVRLAKQFFFSCLYNNSTQHARSSSDEPNQSAFERD